MIRKPQSKPSLDVSPLDGNPDPVTPEEIRDLIERYCRINDEVVRKIILDLLGTIAASDDGSAASVAKSIV